MRKTDKSAKLNKPPKAKVEGGGIGTLKQTKEEISEANNLLEKFKKLTKGQKAERLKQGKSYEFDRMKAEIEERKIRKLKKLETYEN